MIPVRPLRPHAPNPVRVATTRAKRALHEDSSLTASVRGQPVGNIPGFHADPSLKRQHGKDAEAAVKFLIILHASKLSAAWAQGAAQLSTVLTGVGLTLACTGSNDRVRPSDSCVQLSLCTLQTRRLRSTQSMRQV